jgi:hypothetical protein
LWVSPELITALLLIAINPSLSLGQSRFSVTPFVEIMRFDGDGRDEFFQPEPVRQGAETVWGVRGAWVLDRRWSLEGEAAFSDTDPELGWTDLRLEGETAPFGVDARFVSANVVYRVPITQRLDLLFSGGVGAIRLAFERQRFQAPCFQETIFSCDVFIVLEGSETDTFLNFAAGVVVPVEQRLRLRLEVRDRIQFCYHTRPPFGVPEIITFTCGESEGAKLHHVASSFGLEVAL